MRGTFQSQEKIIQNKIQKMEEEIQEKMIFYLNKLQAAEVIVQFSHWSLFIILLSFQLIFFHFILMTIDYNHFCHQNKMKKNQLER